jgi:hypothetical protein
MLDRYSKAVLTVIALALLALCVEVGAYVRSPPVYRVVLTPAHAPSAPAAAYSPGGDLSDAARRGLDEATEQPR